MLAALAAGFSGCVSRWVMPETEPRAASFFDQTELARGGQLAAAGNCFSCHTVDGGKPYAGGRPLRTPFGVIYGTNITPDPDTGIGRWSLAAFARAMREGLDREGRHLYPAFPYDHFTLLTDEDIGALYAFFMTREPVRAESPASRVSVPRFLVAAWNAMFLEKRSFRPDPAQSTQWNSGAYLVEAVAHCGACHTPRNLLGAEKKNQPFAGGESEDWHGPALNASSPSPVPWTADALYTYLRTGMADLHGMSAGPMTEVVHNLAQISEEDLRAIATYVAALDTRSGPERERTRDSALARARRQMPVIPGDERNAGAIERGGAIYAGACADCHDRGRAVEGGALRLPLGTALTLPTPRNLIHIIRDGIVPDHADRGPWMPDYAGALTEQQLTDLVIYLRALTDKPAWTDVPGDVRRILDVSSER